MRRRRGWWARLSAYHSCLDFFQFSLSTWINCRKNSINNPSPLAHSIFNPALCNESVFFLFKSKEWEAEGRIVQEDGSRSLSPISSLSWWCHLASWWGCLCGYYSLDSENLVIADINCWYFQYLVLNAMMVGLGVEFLPYLQCFVTKLTFPRHGMTALGNVRRL